jgi:hypothetical protein
VAEALLSACRRRRPHMRSQTEGHHVDRQAVVDLQGQQPEVVVEWQMCEYLNSQRDCPQCGKLRHRQRPGVRLWALGQQLRHWATAVVPHAGVGTGARVRQGFHAKQAGGSPRRADTHRPRTTSRRNQAHHALDRQRWMMSGRQHPGGSQQALLTGWAPWYHLGSSQRRAKQAGQWGVAVEGRPFPTSEGCRNRQLLTSGGVQQAVWPGA